ncbi:MAG: ABC transporter permease [Elusimicrobia bacterium]|nr:ABC transporter permease [Elusimicrobiota bacterium]
MSHKKWFGEMFSKPYWNMVGELAFSNFKQKDQGTFFGFLWTLINPLLYFLVLYTIFNKWMGSKVSDFPLYLIIGIVQWNFFSSATTNAISAILSNASVIVSMDVEKSALVFSSVLSVLFSHIVELITLIIVFVLIKGTISLYWLWLIPLLVLNIYLVVSFSFILATVGVYFLDMSRIWGLAMSIGFFLTPIFYPMSVISQDKRIIILCNPMTHIIYAARSILIDRAMPAFGGLLYVVILSTILFVFGFAYFKKKEGYFVEKIYG